MVGNNKRLNMNQQQLQLFMIEFEVILRRALMSIIKPYVGLR